MTSPYAPPAPAPYVRPARNKLGIASLVIALVAAVLLPFVGYLISFVGTLTGDQQNQDTVGWAVIGGFVGGAFGLAIAGPLCLIAIVLAIIALTRKGYGKVTAIIAIVVGAPVAMIGIFLLVVLTQTFQY